MPGCEGRKPSWVWVAVVAVAAGVVAVDAAETHRTRWCQWWTNSYCDGCCRKTHGLGRGGGGWNCFCSRRCSLPLGKGGRQASRTSYSC